MVGPVTNTMPLAERQPGGMALPQTTGPVAQGNAARREAELTRLQHSDYPEYVRQMRAELPPQDHENPFAYSLDHDIPIEVKRQVFAEYQSGQNAPRVEIGNLSGSNATFDERAGPNGTIRINEDLIGNDPARRGQNEAFAVWGHMEEVGHWADARAQTLMGRPGGDSVGDEGARFALIASEALTQQPRDAGMITRYDVPVTSGRPRTVEVDTVVLKALAAEKLSNGSFLRENRVDGVENFGPEGHYQTTYITAVGVGSRMGMAPAEVDRMANRLALGSQLPDMLENYDAVSQITKKGIALIADGAAPMPMGSYWTPAEEAHLRSIYEGLHALPGRENATLAWQRSERDETAAFIRERIGAGDFVTAGVAIHRYGDLHAHVRADGLPYSGDAGHGLSGIEPGNRLDSHTPDYLYARSGWSGVAVPWDKVTSYQSSLSSVLADGVARYQTNRGKPPASADVHAAAEAGRTTWRGIYDSALATSATEPHWGPDGANPGRATEVYFRNSASAFIAEFHRQTEGPLAPLPIGQMEVGGGYRPSAGDIRSLDRVADRFDAVP